MQNIASDPTSFLLLAVLLFLTTVHLLDVSGRSSRPIDLATALVGHLRGGLAHVNILNSLLIGGISCSSAADTASTTKVIISQMVKRGYSRPFVRCHSCGSVLPNIVPPAIAV
ncbi:TRAP transporter large permease subunit [Mesorhizobium intechi]|uniref:TRAP transporter large permease subunit n=1 Tax=Mesorhizobium intechi TaxID=537601 RepID=UPI00142EEFC2|nr:TRAP transporter large permease subunit [Mesorhizobium intechi]